MQVRRLTAALLFTFATAASAADPAVWPQWRGPDRDGVLRHAAPWPDTLDGLIPVWRAADLGPSYSGPVVTADRVFTTATVDKKTEVVLAFDRATGRKLWSASWPGSMEVPFFAAKNGSWVRSTPATDGERLYVAGMRDVLVALDVATGKEVWRVDFMDKLKAPLPQFGFVCSPLVDADGVYAQAGASFVKVDKRTGTVLWRTLVDSGGMWGSAFSSPVFAALAGVDQVLVQTRTDLAGVDRKTGEVLWKRPVPAFRGMNILTPQPVGADGVFTSTYGGTTQLVKLTASGSRLAAADGWAFKYEGNMTSPVVVGGHAYLLGKDRRLICVDLASGKETWRSEKRFGEYWSLVANGDKLLGLDNRGVLYLLRANPNEFDLLAEKKVADAESWAHLAVCGDTLFIRDLTGLTALRWGK
ncbi:MAG: PQQ-binding-like beta-propeller repeat protein [Gemmataceae bacterium]